MGGGSVVKSAANSIDEYMTFLITLVTLHRHRSCAQSAVYQSHINPTISDVPCVHFAIITQRLKTRKERQFDVLR